MVPAETRYLQNRLTNFTQIWHKNAVALRDKVGAKFKKYIYNLKTITTEEMRFPYLDWQLNFNKT